MPESDQVPLRWFRVNADLLGHPKLARLSAALGSRGAALDALLSLWTWTARYHPSGKLSPTDYEALTLELTEPVVSKLTELGWIDPSRDPDAASYFVVHEWQKYSGASVRKLAYDRAFSAANRKRMRMMGRRTTDERPSYESRPLRIRNEKYKKTSLESGKDSVLNAPAPLAAPGIPLGPVPLGADAQAELDRQLAALQALAERKP